MSVESRKAALLCLWILGAAVFAHVKKGELKHV
jgi:hypothetical protein